MKLCKDCRHIQLYAMGYAVCVHPDAPRNPVDGHFEGSCELLRSSNCLITPRCGQAANWFDPKQAESNGETA